MKIQIDKIKLSLLTFLICYGAIAQKEWNTKSQTYKGGVVTYGFIDVELSEIVGSLRPLGKNVTLVYDPFFNSYSFEWEEEKGNTQMILKHQEKTSAGDIYYDDERDNEFFIHNDIDKNNTITLIRIKQEILRGRKVKIIFVFRDLK